MGQEQKVDETRGSYMQAMKHGQELTETDWRECRIVLTTERLVLAGDEQRSISIADVDRIGDRYDVNNAAAAESHYTTLYVGEDVYLVSAPDHETFETNLFHATLDGAIVYVKHPAVEGGVVQGAEWQRGRTKITTTDVRLITEDGTKVTIEREDVGELETAETRVDGEDLAAIEVEHTDAAGTSVETHISGRENHVSVLERLLDEGAKRNRVDLDLDHVERRVVMALYSGVSPFGISEFVGIDVERVEEIYDRLLELDVIEVERERTEVALTAQGRTVAGEAMGER